MKYILLLLSFSILAGCGIRSFPENVEGSVYPRKYPPLEKSQD